MLNLIIMKKFKNKNIIITGASSGIGRSFALKCGEDGAKIFLAARSKDKLEKVKKIVNKKGSTGIVVPTDVTEDEQIKNLFLRATKNSEKIDFVFNNAGLGFVQPIHKISPQQIHTMINVNITGMIMVTKFASEIMSKQKYGHIVMTSSLAGLITMPQWSVYCATKWAITAFTDSIREELKEFGVKISTLHPGLVKTNFFAKNQANIDLEEIEEQPIITPDQVADAVYQAAFTNQNKIVIPKIAKSYAWIYKYLPNIYKKLLNQASKDMKTTPTDYKSQFSYVNCIQNCDKDNNST